MTQSKATNIPLFLIFRIQLIFISWMRLTATELTITSVFFQYMTFFAFGGSNAISSVDLSSAYNGIGGYSIIFVGILTFAGNWAGPIWWSSAVRLLLPSQGPMEKWKRASLLTLHITTSLLSIMGACMALRSHLFVWTVFSPKFLYAIAWTMLNHVVVNMLGGAGLAFF